MASRSSPSALADASSTRAGEVRSRSAWRASAASFDALRLSRSQAFYLQASIIVFFLAGSSAPTPLYALYQSAWRFSPITVTVVFGIYALAVLGTLLVFGSLSDHVGRRPVLFVTTLMQAATMVIFATAQGVGALLVARVVQGLATGAAAGAVGAGMLDLDRPRGTIANAVGPMLGTATGALGSGLMVQYLPAPTHLVYLWLGAIFIAQALGVSLMAEPTTPRPGALASLRPHFRIPRAAREPVWLAAPALVGAWALVGFYGSLGPLLVRRLAGASSPALGGLALAVLALGGAAAVVSMLSKRADELMNAGMLGLVAGVSLTVFAIEGRSLTLFFVGTAVAGAGFGGAFQGAIRSVVPRVEAHERAGVLSVIYVIAYLAMGLPAVLGGARLVATGDVFATAREYGDAVILLSASALAASWLRRRSAEDR